MNPVSETAHGLDEALHLASLNHSVNLYFQGVYQADAELLRRAFHPEAQIVGRLGDQSITMSLDQLIERVRSLPSDASRGSSCDKWVLGMDVCGSHAAVRARVRSGDFWFNDFLVLSREDTGWVIRFKAFNDAGANQAPPA